MMRRAMVVAAAQQQAETSSDPNAKAGAAMMMGMFGQSLAPENVAFALKNYGALEKFMQSMQAIGGPKQ